MTDLLHTPVNTSDREASRVPYFKLAGTPSVPEGMSLPSGKPLQVLILLIVNAGKTVPLADLNMELWNGEPPRTAHSTLQTYIFKIRKCIGDRNQENEEDKLLRTTIGGYRLDIKPEQVDALWFLEVTKSIKRGYDQQQLRQCLEALDAALGIIQGTLLTGIPLGPILERWARGVENVRWEMLLWRIETVITLGGEREVLTELARISAIQPLHEGFAMQRMLALYRCGRSAEAVQVFLRLRYDLRERLGVDPSRQVKDLYVRILREDQTL